MTKFLEAVKTEFRNNIWYLLMRHSQSLNLKKSLKSLQSCVDDSFDNKFLPYYFLVN